MNNYDVIVIGGGLAGSALSYELVKKNLRVLLLEKDTIFDNATVYSYGGIAYWCGSDDLTTKLSNEGINIHRNLSAELEADTEFKELDLLFTIAPEQNPQEVESAYQHFHIKPQLLDRETSVELEPLLNKDAIVGTLKFPQGHVNPKKTVLAYQNAFLNLGGKIINEKVIEIEKNEQQITGIKTNKNSYSAEQIIISAGAFSRSLLQQLGINLPIYFSHAQLIKTKPSNIKLRTLIMPATTKRLDIEKQLTEMKKSSLWENPNNEIKADVLEAGAIQFADGSLCFGQISQIITNINAQVQEEVSEQRIREAVGKILPALSSLEGECHNCKIAFSQGMPFQVGKIRALKGLSIFSGFTSPFVFVPPLAKHFANYLVKGRDEVIDSLPELT
jgi:glycine/D-amino acid oxidase-like deaminating enzyme